MIELTRLNGHKICVNCDLIRYAEASPDTVLTLVTGEKLVVLETTAEVTHLTALYRAELLRCAWPLASSNLASALAAHTAHNPTDPHPFFDRA